MSEVLDRLIAAVGAENAQEGGFILDNLEAVAFELDRMWDMGVNFMPERFFPTLAIGDDLTLAAENFGIVRRAGTPASVVLTVTGEPGTQIDGTVKAAAGEKIFALSPAIIPETGIIQVNATADEPGIDGNVLPGSINTFISAYDGLYNATNENAAYGGSDIESDADLRARVLAYWQTPSTGGNQGDYIRWALSVDGVSRVRVQNPTAGNVDVYIIATGNTEPSSELLSEVSAYIGTVRPVGANVSVYGGSAVEMNVTASIILADGFNIDDVQTRVTTAISDYLNSIAYNQDLVSYLKIADCIFVDGIVDILSYTLNGGESSIALSDVQFPTLGVVSVVAG